MWQENVEIARGVFDNFQAGMERGDHGAWFDSAAVADDFEWIIAPPGLDGRSVWHGREGFVEFLRTWTEQFEDWSIRVERWIDAGDDRVVALTHQSAAGIGSGVPVEMKLGLVYELENGRVVQEELLQPRRCPRSRRAVGVAARSRRDLDRGQSKS
ncbi:MAG TPA: nuclear transport factor 2 family protein, partial [Solirubrobacterales bacterium]|nr:nuclear transport factor 2 family protein [Solirubrobacterales bacterium]